MHDDNNRAPESGETQQDDGQIRYFEVDETNVSGATESPQPTGDDPPRFDQDDEAS